MLELNKCT